MLIFCPVCSNLLVADQNYANESRSIRFMCQTCPYFYAVKRDIRVRRFTKVKELDDVLGGEEAWKNVDATEVNCVKCGHDKAYFLQVQTRSADEPMTIFYRCCSCAYQWKE